MRAVMNLYEGAKTRVRVGPEWFEEFEVNVGVHRGFMFLPLLFAIVVDVITESVRNGLTSELLYVDDLVLTKEMMERLREKFWKTKEAFKNKGLKVNLGKTKVAVSGAEGEVSVNKVDPCCICRKRVMSNSVLCVKCKEWIHGRCTKVKRVTLRLGRDFVCGRCKKQADVDCKCHLMIIIQMRICPRPFTYNSDFFTDNRNLSPFPPLHTTPPLNP